MNYAPGATVAVLLGGSRELNLDETVITVYR